MSSRGARVLFGIAVALYLVSLAIRFSTHGTLRWPDGLGAVVLAAVAFSMFRKPAA
jgi:hypothetical protein